MVWQILSSLTKIVPQKNPTSNFQKNVDGLVALCALSLPCMSPAFSTINLEVGNLPFNLFYKKCMSYSILLIIFLKNNTWNFEIFLGGTFFL